jgi:hypothetical protein
LRLHGATTQKTAIFILGYYTKKKRNECYDEECRTVLEIRNAARMKMLQRKTRTNIPEYKKAQREAKLVCKRGKKAK